jgi:RimJ/RimL family protein N-acetyltransferase
MIELQPVLHGPTLTLRPLQPDDFEALYAAASDPLIWVQNPQPTRYQRDVFRKVFDSGIESNGAFVVIDRAKDEVIGTSRYYDWKPDEREVAIGYTFLARAYWGGATNGEMKKLMLDHIFQYVDTVWFHIGVDNWRSRKALEKIGGMLSHYADRTQGEKLVPYTYYKITKPA